MLRRIVSVSIAVVMMALYLPAIGVFAVDEWTVAPAVYDDVSGIAITGYSGSEVDVTIPATIDGQAVIGVADSVFSGNTQINSVTLPDSVRYIGAEAFAGCTAMRCVILNEGLIEIGNGAFVGNTSMNSVIVYDTTTIIGDGVFDGCDSVLVYCFEFSAMQQYAVEHQIAYEVFSGGKFVTIADILYLLADKVAKVFSCAVQVSGDIIIPETIEYEGVSYPVTEIAASAFANCQSIQKVTLPETIVRMGQGAFYNSGVTEINIPSRMEEIPKEAFVNCKNLTMDFIIPETVKRVGDVAFDGTGIASLEIQGNPEFGYTCFGGCLLKKVTMSNTLTSLGEYMFSSCWQLQQVVFSENITEIPNGLFNGCDSLTKLRLPSGLKRIKNRAFRQCTNLQIVIPQSVTEIDAPDGFDNDVFDFAAIIQCFEGSYAHHYAEENGLRYTLIDDINIPDIATSMPVTGFVTYLSGSPAAGSSVRLYNAEGEQVLETIADSTGRYTFDKVAIGQYTLTATDANGCTSMEVISVRRMTVFDVFLTGNTGLTLKDTAAIYGCVTVNGSGVADAEVTLLDEAGNVIATVISDADGNYRFSSIPDGSYTVKAQTINGSAVETVILFHTNMECNLAIQATVASIAGTITNDSGEVMSSAEVGLFTFGGAIIATTRTNADGMYAFANVPHGQYAVYARADWQKDSQLVSGTGCAFVEVTENRIHTIDITLHKQMSGKTTVEGKVTAQGQDQKNATVVLTDVFGNEVASYRTKANGKYAFNHVADGVYTIAATTATNKGSAMTVIVVKDGMIHGETDLWVAKSDKIAKHQEKIVQIASGDTKSIAEEKSFYDSLSEVEKSQFDPAYVQTLNHLIGDVTEYDIQCNDSDIIVEQTGLAVSADEILNNQKIGFTVTVQQTQAVEIPETGVETAEQFAQQQIVQAAGNERDIFAYYEIGMEKTIDAGKKTINTIRKDTDTTGELLVTLPIPQEFLGHANYSVIHMHNGNPVTLADLDDNPDTVTIRVSGFSKFAFAYDDMVNQAAEDAVVTVTDTQVTVSCAVDAVLYLASYDSSGQTLFDVIMHPVAAGTQNSVFSIPDGFTNIKVILWDAQLQPLAQIE